MLKEYIKIGPTIALVWADIPVFLRLHISVWVILNSKDM
jgi:hypothetical protein